MRIGAFQCSVRGDQLMALRGSTSHFNVSYEDGLGSDGAAAADAILATCEDDYSALTSAFGGVQPPGLPFSVIVEDGHPFSAFHFGCNDTTLHVGIPRQPLDTAISQLLTVAEVDECFMAAKGLGWDCGKGNGEALSVALALDRYPVLGGTYTRAWWDAGRPDYVSVNVPTDGNQISNRCGAVFLFFLHSYLGFEWADITGAGGATLAETYARLTGAGDAYGHLLFATDEFPPSDTDNPFNILPVYAQLIDLQMP
jgi:hypothetical protein